MINLGAAMAGGSGKRRADDFYPTPDEATEALLPVIAHWPLLVWEPACGDGAMARVLQRGGREVRKSDLVDRGCGADIFDFLQQRTRPADVLVTNPPFNLAAEFILHAKRLGVTHMALLLKATFWNAARREKLFREWPPSRILPLLWRLDFDGGGAPTMDCMWVLWEPGATPTTFAPLAKPPAPKADAQNLFFASLKSVA